MKTLNSLFGENKVINARFINTAVRRFLVFSLPLFLTLSACQTPTSTNSDTDGFEQIFDGKTLAGWEGEPTLWRVENGELIGEITPNSTLEQNSFLIWKGDMPADFELKVEYKISPKGNSGINYRSERVEGVPYGLKGYQADLDGQKNYIGSNYEERKRTTLASQGEVVIIPAIENADSIKMYSKKNQWTPRNVTGSLGDKESLRSKFIDEDWNEYHLIIKGNRLQHWVNGVLMSDVTDNDEVNRRLDGLLGVQVHVGPPMKVAYRNFRIKALK